MVPGGFVFVIDTTDRTFVYKSSNNPDYEQQVISLDKVHGIDTLTKFSDFYEHTDDRTILKLRRIGQNTYLGICAHKDILSGEQWNYTDRYFRINHLVS